MTFYEPNSVIPNFDPFSESFQRLSMQKVLWQRYYLSSIALALFGYPATFAFLFLTAGQTPPGHYSHMEALDFVLGLVFLLMVGWVSNFLSTRADMLRLPREHIGFLRVYLAKKDIEDYVQHPDRTRKLVLARSRLRQVVSSIPYGRKDSLIAIRALKGTSELRAFINERLIPYLSPPLETERAVHSLGYLAQYLLDPTIDGLPFILDHLNLQLPETASPHREPFGYRVVAKIRNLLLKAEARMSWVTDMFIALLVGGAIFGVAVVGMGAPPYDGFLGASAAFIASFFGIRYERRQESNSSR